MSRLESLQRAIARLIAYPFLAVGKALFFIDSFHKRFPTLYHFALVILVTPIAFLAWTKAVPADLFREQLGHVFYQAFHFIAAGVTAFVFSVLLSAVLPLFLYLPYAAEMRTMGLLRIATGDGQFQRFLEIFLKQHDGNKSVKVLCISGRHLFREPRAPLSKAPLAGLARQAKLDVVMPVATSSNPTVISRYESYDSQYRQGVYPRVDDLLREISLGKEYLDAFGNSVVQHNILCTWRVVILSNVCLVQNYFPNNQGEDSDKAPVFVFENSPECTHSYYLTFSTMFDLVKKHPGTATLL